MSLKRIAQLFAAQNANQLVVVLTQLLLPAAFLHNYGTALYGQWVALSAAVTYLSTLHVGLQTYTNMQTTIHYNRGEFEECRMVQSAGTRILLGAFVLFAVVLSSLFFLPIDTWLNLTVARSAAQWTLYLLSMQIMGDMVFGFFAGSYMVFGEAHRGAHLANAYYLANMLIVVTLATLHQSFPVLAGMQLVSTLVFTVIAVFDLRRRAPDLKPTVRYWQKGALGATLKPSMRYMLLASSNLIAYQVPILLMQRLLGPTVVVMYAVTRTIYSMSRRLLTLLSGSISAEITLLYGQRDWAKLFRLYVLSERIIMMMTPPITFGSMFATPLLLTLWLHKPQLFNPGVCITLGLVVSVLSIKEHKYQFQTSTNEISGLSWTTLVSYSLMSLLTIPLMLRFGLQGFLVTWLVFECGQLAYMLHLNDKLFAGHEKLDHRAVYSMLAILVVCAALAARPMYSLASISFLLQGTISVAVTLILGVCCYKLFEVDEVRQILWSKIAGRVPFLAARRS